MLKRVGFLVSLWMLVAWGVADAQADVAPRYAVAFSALVEGANGPAYRVHVASLGDDGQWRVDVLDENLHFGKFDAMWIVPHWLDARLLIPGAQPDVNVLDGPTQPYDSLYQYDLNTGEVQLLIEQITAPDGQNSLHGFFINEVSPDGRFAVLDNTIEAIGGYVVDLTTGQVIAGGLCHLNVLAWLPNEVIVTHTLTAIYDPDICQPAIYGIDLTDGTITRELANPDTFSHSEAEQWDNTVRDGFLFDDDLLLTTSGVVSLLPLDGSSPLNAMPMGPYSTVTVALDGRFAALNSPHDGLQWLDLATFTITPITAAEGNLWSMGNGEYIDESGIGFWVEEDNDTYTLKYVRYDGADRQETVVYSGPAPDHYGRALAPEQPYAALSFEREDYSQYTDIYDAEGQLLWTSRDQFDEFSVRFDLPGHPWLGNAQWVHLDLRGGEVWGSRTLSVDLATRGTHLAPANNARLVSVSPDSTWWLYAVEHDSDDGWSLLAYNWQSRETITLYDGARVYFPGDQSPALVYVWKPIEENAPSEHD